MLETEKPRQKQDSTDGQKPKEVSGLTIKAVGDICLPTVSCNEGEVARLTPDSFGRVKSLFASSDLVIGNLEGAITDKLEGKVEKTYNFSFAPGVAAQTLVDSGFDIVSLANNHISDYGPAGEKDTMSALDGAKLPYFGVKDQVRYLNVGGKSVGFVGFYGGKPGFSNSVTDFGTVKALVARAKAQAGFVVVGFHGGEEGEDYIEYLDSLMIGEGKKRHSLFIDFARTAIDSGADCVIGTHPHLLRAMELYKGKPIAYSLGNFVATGGLSVEGVRKRTAVLELNFDDQGEFCSGRIIPIKINAENERRPELDTDRDTDSSAESTISIIQRLTKSYYQHFGLEKNLEIADDGKVTPVKSK